MVDISQIGVVILAAGRGTRLNCVDVPKVMLEIGGNPVVSYIVDTLLEMGLEKEQISLVVGYKKEKIEEYFGKGFIYSHQKEQEGTAHAAFVGMKYLPDHIKNVLVIGGDDSAFYTKETLLSIVGHHLESSNVLSLLTVNLEDPSAIGRIIRNKEGNMIGVLEKEELDEEEKKIKEASTGTFCFNRDWFEGMFPSMPKIAGLGEYGLPKAVEMAIAGGEKVEGVKLENNNEWFGINTPEELREANRRKTS